MKKIFIVLAMLLVFSVLYSCSGGSDEQAESSDIESMEETSKETEADTQNRISQSTLPPLETEGDGAGGDGDDSTPQGNKDHFVYETNDNTADNLYVTEDEGFGGEINQAN